jgi:L-alanine-DL-glutamate epimerase-like enolase superfamily enzyme
MTISDGHAHAPADPGMGIDRDPDAVRRMSVDELTREIRQ